MKKTCCEKRWNLRAVTIIFSYGVIVMFILSCGNANEKHSKNDPMPNNWQEIISKASASKVTLMMWKGSPFINQYMNDYVVPELKSRYHIDLEIISGQGNAIVSTLMSELEARKSISEIDMMWINGETFYQLRQIHALYGPFVDLLPNSAYINWSNPYIAMDFQQSIDGYECPWGNVQFAMIYDSEAVASPPQNLIELEQWVKQNPGKFTITNDFTGMTLLKSWLIHFAGGKGSLKGPFDEANYELYSAELWTYINRIKPYFWNRGKSFPATLSQAHALFANGELFITMSNNDSEVSNKILQGAFPTYCRAYVPQIGSIQNSHYLGIASHSEEKEAAMVVINFLISPEAQWEKMKPGVWGDGTVLDVSRLSNEWQSRFDSLSNRIYAPKREDIQKRALMEPAPEYMIRLFEDFRKKVIEN